MQGYPYPVSDIGRAEGRTVSHPPSRASRVLAFAFAVLMAVPVLAILAPGGAEAATAGPNPPKGVHLSWSTASEVKITWHTASASTSRAEWGTAPGPPYDNAAAGTDYDSPGGAPLHVVTLASLQPNTLYYYRVGDAAMTSWFGEGTFRSPVAAGAPETFRFAAAGDWGYGDVVEATANAVGAWDPNLMLILGDHYYSDQEANVRMYYEKTQAFGDSSLVMSGMGNHEYARQGPDGQYNTPTPVHCAYVNLPGNERTYSFTYGNTLFLTADFGTSVTDQADGVDASGPNCGGSPGTPGIRAWLDGQLAAADANPAITWRVLYAHFQCYLTDYEKNNSLCPDGSGDPDQLEDILVNRKVDLVLTAHGHTLRRTYPLRFNQTVQGGSTYDRPGAPIYLVAGTGGSPRTNTCRTAPYIAVCRAPIATAGYARFTVTPTRIDYQFMDNSAGQVDSFTLLKAPLTGFDVTVAPGAATVTRGETATATVTVAGVSNGTVSLAQSGCPPAATCTFSASQGSPTFTSMLTATTDASTPLGTYLVTILASNATMNDTAAYTLTVVGSSTRTFQKGDGGAHSETDDTYLYSGTPNGNFGTQTKMYVDASGCIASQTVCKSLVKFPDFIGGGSGQVPPGY